MKQTSQRKSESVSKDPHLIIHHYYTQRGVDTFDDDGEPMLGHYWQVMKDATTPACEPFGPYGDFDEAAKEGRQAFKTGAY